MPSLADKFFGKGRLAQLRDKSQNELKKYESKKKKKKKDAKKTGAQASQTYKD